ncbi:biotin--[acetyl-CoA-carboxylase] ligase [Arcobacter arenosus]|jgi:BirA family biotin operon repressor/biotin-[acetyl-CoA-carboxylase] ligase|uniref:Biotin--[acetyl-CoA-carboxylase] ligase n=1 Tax=Arcobacter arenosus TaxID=2576037 RepID=A0A5R8XYK6_9BACT|nr:biotin--[acetyl-CoA-carboxylase] ligase [Arcobacter arenosus]TLP36862.1 biotin--[acetyl-CoA-carboxylase] ligase [Arcobacter arenosus]
MEIIILEEVDSTHTYLKNKIKEEGFTYPICITAKKQTNGIGSRGNSWQGKEGNLFFSFVLEKKNLPKDLQLQSASIYFSFILKKVLSSLGSSLWLKWPNDFYIDDKKIGGTITTATKDLVLCGIGLNLIEVSSDFGKLDINIDIKETLENYFKKLEFEQSWKQIFSEYKIEFKKSENFTATINNNKISLKKAILNEDGSIEINNTRVFSLR